MHEWCYSGRGQAMPRSTKQVDAEAFDKRECTEIRWLTGGHVMINARGTTILVDPLLTGFDMPLLVQPPLKAEDIPAVDAVLVTHIDNDHFSAETCLVLKDVCRSYHATEYVAGEMRRVGLPGEGHAIGGQFCINDVRVTLTPAKHNWQAYFADFAYREWMEEEYCGYWFDTPDGTIWLPGDSQLLESHLNMPQPDVILFDFSDNEWHITLDGAVRLANAYPNAQLLCIHWGTVDAPDMTPFNADPKVLFDRVVNPERIRVLGPGEPLRINA